VSLSETKSSVTKEVSVKLFLFFVLFFVLFFTYYVGIAIIARWPASGISSELLLIIKTFDINFTITYATQKSLDDFIIRFGNCSL
jgi:hypothetical protein